MRLATCVPATEKVFENHFEPTQSLLSPPTPRLICPAFARFAPIPPENVSNPDTLRRWRFARQKNKMSAADSPLESTVPFKDLSAFSSRNGRGQGERGLFSVWCLRNSYPFVALKLACSEARGGRIPPVGCNRRATKLQANFSATLRAAVLFRADFVARSLQIHAGYARRSRLVRTKNSVPRM